MSSSSSYSNSHSSHKPRRSKRNSTTSYQCNKPWKRPNGNPSNKNSNQKRINENHSESYALLSIGDDDSSTTADTSEQYFLFSSCNMSDEVKLLLFKPMCVKYRYLLCTRVIKLGQTTLVPHLGSNTIGVLIAHFPVVNEPENGLYIMPCGHLKSAMMDQLCVWMKMSS